MGWKFFIIAFVFFQNISWAQERIRSCGNYFAKISGENNREALESFYELFGMEAEASDIRAYSGIYRTYSGRGIFVEMFDGDPDDLLSTGYLYRADNMVEVYGGDFIHGMVEHGCLALAFYRREIRRMARDRNLWETIDRDRRHWVDFTTFEMDWEELFIITRGDRLGTFVADELRVMFAGEEVLFPNQWKIPQSN